MVDVTMTETILEMRGITKNFPGVLANDHVDLVVKRGEIHALLGENGAGKTTLMNILYGLYGRDSGEIIFNGQHVNIHSPQEAISVGIGMVHQEFMLLRPFTVVENIALGLDTGKSPFLAMDEVRKRIIDLSERYGLAVDPDARVEHLSVGVQQRVEIVKLLVRSAQLLILDEPTAVLTPQEIDGLFEILRSLAKDGHSVVFITHKLNEVIAATDTVTILRDGKVIDTKPTKDTNPNELAWMMVGREVLFRTFRDPCAPGEALLEVKDLHAIDERGVPALQGVSFEICEGEILGIAGVAGNGQTQLADVLAGLSTATRGNIRLDGKDITNTTPSKRHALGLAYVPADRREVGCFVSLDITKNTIMGRLGEFTRPPGIFMDARKIKQHAENIVTVYDIRTPNTKVLAGKLSGGNLQKLLIGREFNRQPRVFIIDQPTRGLDVGATEYVRSKVIDARKKGTAVLLISSELDEILDLSDRILVLFKGEIMGTLQGGAVDIQDLGLMMAGTRQTELHQAKGNDPFNEP
jgi:general nucleoside transport system ATP-binding protein